MASNNCENANFSDVAVVLDDVLLATGLVFKHNDESVFFEQYTKQLQLFVQTWYKDNPDYDDSDGDFVVDAEVEEDSEEMSEASESDVESE